MQKTTDVSDLWIAHQRKNAKTTISYACVLCPDRKIFPAEPDLWQHAKSAHFDRLPPQDEELEVFRKNFEEESRKKLQVHPVDLEWFPNPAIEEGKADSENRPIPKSEESARKPNMNESNRSQPDPGGQGKRPHSIPNAPTRSLSAYSALGVSALNIGTPRDMGQIASAADADDEHVNPDTDGPRKRAAIGGGISAGSASPFRETSPETEPRKPKTRPTSAPDFDIQRPQPERKTLWTENDVAPTRSSVVVDRSNIASLQGQKQRAQALQPKARKAFQQATNTRSPVPQTPPAPGILRNPKVQSPAAQTVHTPPKDERYDIVLQPETRPISQEQLVAEVKGIYAGLVMVEAKCIEVDNKVLVRCWCCLLKRHADLNI